MEDASWVGKLLAERGDTVLVMAMALATISYLGGKALQHGLGHLWLAAAKLREEQARWYGLKADELQTGRTFSERMDALEKGVTSLHALIDRSRDDMVAAMKDPEYDRRRRNKRDDG